MTQAAPAAPQTPSLPAPAKIVVQEPNVVTPAFLTAKDVSVLRGRRAELSDQLRSATGRRVSVQKSLERTSSAAGKAGLEKQLVVLDDRIARLESDIDENGKTLASLPAQAAGSSTPAFSDLQGNHSMPDTVVPIAIVFTLFVLAPIAFSISRMFWKRGSMPKATAPSADQTERLQRMEQAIDSIAIEMERVSEGQRFVTRILAEGRPGAAVGAGAAQPVQVPVNEQLGLRR
jgi:hypothetical protein